MKLGIDFGSTYTYIYTYTSNGGLQDICELNFANTLGGAGIPTLIERKAGQIKIGKEVEFKEELLLKDRFRKHYLPNMREVINYEELIKDTIAFFNEIIKLAGINKRSVTEVVFGVPVTSDWEYAMKGKDHNGVEMISYASDMIKDVFSKVFPGVSVQCLEEPILAGMSELSSDGTITEKDIFLVADFGGGTNDFALIQKKKNGKWHVIKTFGGGGGSAGRDLDVAIQKEIEGQKGKVSLQRVREAKESFFTEELRDDEESRRIAIPIQGSDDQVVVAYGVNSPDVVDVFDVVEGWIDGAIAPKNEYKDYIATHKKNAATHLIFAGGTSNIGPLRSAFFECVNAVHKNEGLPLISDDEEHVRKVKKPAAAVARGAAMYSIKSVSESEDERPQDYYLCLTNGAIEQVEKLKMQKAGGKCGNFWYAECLYKKTKKGVTYLTSDAKQNAQLKGDCKFYFKKGERRFPLDKNNEFFEIEFPMGRGTIMVVYPEPMKRIERTLYFWIVPEKKTTGENFFGISHAVLYDITMYSLNGKIEQGLLWNLTQIILKEKEA